MSLTFNASLYINKDLTKTKTTNKCNATQNLDVRDIGWVAKDIGFLLFLF